MKSCDVGSKKDSRSVLVMLNIMQKENYPSGSEFFEQFWYFSSIFYFNIVYCNIFRFPHMQ